MPKRTLGYFFIICAALGWSLLGLFNRTLTASGVSLYNMVLIRFGGSAILFTAFCLLCKREVFRIKLRHLPLFIGSGVISMMLLGLVYFRAQQLCSIAVACILMYLAPSFVVLFSVFFWKTAMTRRKLLSLAMTLFGCALVSGLVGNDIQASPMGILMGVMAGLFYAGYTVFSHYTMQHYDGITSSYWSFLFAGLSAALLPIDWQGLGTCFTSFRILPAAAALVICSSLLPFFLYTKGLETLESGRAAIVANLEPVFAAVFGAVFLHEIQNIWNIIGIASVIGGVILLATEKSSSKA